MSITAIKICFALFVLPAFFSFSQNGLGAPLALSSETPFFLPSKAFFSVPKGWFIEEKNKGFRIMDPDQLLTLVITDSPENFDSDAIREAWKEFFPDFSLISKVSVVEKKVEIWDQVSKARYYYSAKLYRTPKEYLHRNISAVALKYKTKWFVVLIDGPQSVAHSHAKEIEFIIQSLRPPGYIKKQTAQ